MSITLRPFELRDVDDFMVWAGDEKVTKYCRWDTFTSREDAVEFLRQIITSNAWYRAICLHGRSVGSIYVAPQGTGKDARRAELGYALSADHWGKGVATEAVKMVVSNVFQEVKGLDRVEGLVYADNKASQRVLEKAGFHKEGVLRKYFYVKGQSRDIVVYSVVNNMSAEDAVF
uniref:N-acetyltransferase domain-containing protein n=1 Tax=Kalanchoe fedtschenkoi TaxID=63787 RepID=A0A7N0UI82_KALFE